MSTEQKLQGENIAISHGTPQCPVQPTSVVVVAVASFTGLTASQ